MPIYAYCNFCNAALISFTSARSSSLSARSDALSVCRSLIYFAISKRLVLSVGSCSPTLKEAPMLNMLSPPTVTPA